MLRFFELFDMGRPAIAFGKSEVVVLSSLVLVRLFKKYLKSCMKYWESVFQISWWKDRLIILTVRCILLDAFIMLLLLDIHII